MILSTGTPNHNINFEMKSADYFAEILLTDTHTHTTHTQTNGADYITSPTFPNFVGGSKKLSLENKILNDLSLIVLALAPHELRRWVYVYWWRRAKQLSYELAFNLTSYLHREQDYVPWAAFFDVVGFIAGMLSTSDAYGPLQVTYLLTYLLAYLLT